MDNLRSVLSIVLSKIPPREILKNNICYDNITKEEFVKLAGYYVKNYTNDELENLFYYIQNEYEEQADYVRGYERRIYDSRSFNIFDAILIFAVRVLQEADGEPVCQYRHMLRWRMTSHELDEDVFTTAFLAFKDIRSDHRDRKFSWRPVIRHNNVYLNRVLMQGMTDNHFHLKGSAPQFPLSWISMMNNVVSKKFRKLIESYSKKRLSVAYSTGSEEEEHLYTSYLKAALIRCYLFSKLTGRIFTLQGLGNSRESRTQLTPDDKTQEKRTDDKTQEKRTDDKTQEEQTDDLVENLLQDKDEILFYRRQIQDNIYTFRMLKPKDRDGKYPLDYALCGRNGYEEQTENVNDILSGERWFMYTMFHCIFTKNRVYRKYYNMFYAYLVIKGTIRSELVQTNTNMGFDNFARYQDRKEDFIENTPFEAAYVEMAVKGTILNQNIRYLEARITPKSRPDENRDYIKKFDHMLKDDEELKKRYFYVFHFIKEKDDPKNLGSDIVCRHHEKRRRLRKQAEAIARFREKYPYEAQRVRGIDACAKEIGCRPEVFAQTYRFLSDHIVYRHEGMMESADIRDIKVRQLFMTYHIGEDYLDIVDGLRAIDEAVHFLQLDCGSRLGHALALGIDIEEYYQVKKGKVLISQQDYLDNLVWLYYRIRKFGLKGYDDLLLFIEKEFSKYFRLIYGNYICDEFFNHVIEKAREHFRRDGESIVSGYCNSHFHFRISEYYSSWKLRGDDPRCYINGYFEELDDFSVWNRYAVNRRFPGDYKIRYNPECAFLYYLYHYCGNAKVEGQKIIEIALSHQWIQCAKEIQSEMKRWIGELGIGIETNPSSNYLIGPFKRYDKHPIFGFYNLGLTTSPEELEACPQLPVCVNTDDQGIFSTYLENEYALLALALEKAKDENGQNKYNRIMIYEWIDNVRKLGINLSFSEYNDDVYRF